MLDSYVNTQTSYKVFKIDKDINFVKNSSADQKQREKFNI